MNRATWLQDRRMEKFRDVLSRWDAGELSMMEAGELLGMSERQFRRYRDRYEEDGLEGLVDGRLVSRRRSGGRSGSGVGCWGGTGGLIGAGTGTISSRARVAA